MNDTRHSFTPGHVVEVSTFAEVVLERSPTETGLEGFSVREGLARTQVGA